MLPIIYFLVGISGSGKSTWAKCWARLKKAIVVSSDAIRAELFGDESVQANAALVFETAHRRVLNALKQGKNVIFDATNVTSWSRQALLDKIAAEGIVAKKIAVIFNISPRHAIQRQESRSRKVPADVIYRQWDNFVIDFDDITIKFDDIIEAT